MSTTDTDGILTTRARLAMRLLLHASTAAPLHEKYPLLQPLVAVWLIVGLVCYFVVRRKFFFNNLPV